MAIISRGGSGGASRGFALGPANNIFGNTSGDTDISSVTIGTNRAAAEATRDAYDTATSGWLAGYTDIDVNIILYYTDSGNPTIQYQRHIGTAWVDNGPPIIAVEGAPGSATDFSGVGAGNLMVVGAGPTFTPEASSVSETSDRVVSTKSFQTIPNTIYIGEESALSASIRAVHIRSGVTGNTGLILAQLYNDSTGFDRAFTYSGDTVDTVSLNDPAGTDNSDTAVFDFTTTANELIIQIDIPTTQISSTVAFSITGRTGSQTGSVAFIFDGNLTTNASGMASLDLSNDYTPFLVDTGTTLYFDVTCDGMIGDDQGGGVFVPNATITRIVTSRVNIPIGEDFTTTLLNKLNGIAAGATVGVIVEDEGSALTTAGTTINFVGSGVTATGDTDEKTISIPGGMSGFTVQDEGSELSTSVTTLNFVGGGVEATGSGTDITITVSGTPTPPQADHTNYIDVTADSNASSVDLVGGVSSDDLNPTVTLETFTGNRYIQILQSQAHSAFNSIIIGGINQFGGFTVNENARTIGGQAYRQFVTTNLITDALSGQQMILGGAV